MIQWVTCDALDLRVVHVMQCRDVWCIVCVVWTVDGHLVQYMSRVCSGFQYGTVDGCVVQWLACGAVEGSWY